MAVVLNPYLGFRDNARQAFEFYQSILGGELDLSRFGDMGLGDESEADKIMHAQLETEDGMVLMGADTPNEGEYAPGGAHFAVSLSGDDDARLREYWSRLSEGGNVEMPLEVAPWGDAFGMCRDKFGIHWMINIGGEQA